MFILTGGSLNGVAEPGGQAWWRSSWQVVKSAAAAFGRDNAMTHAAALAFFTGLSFAPLVLLVVTVGGMLGQETGGQLVDALNRTLGSQAAAVSETVIEQQQDAQQQGGAWRLAVGIAMLLISASIVFAQLQASLNHLWGVKATPRSTIWGFIRVRLLSIGLILAILFIMLVSLVLSAIVEQIVPQDSVVLGRIASFVVSLVVFTLVFAAIYRIMPDARISWADTLAGAVATALLFALGKLVIGLYMQHASVGSDYGSAAGSMIALLVWVYYSSVILLFGAELTKSWAVVHGSGIEPAPHAVRVAPA